jgi:hypothetical protein
MKWKKYPADFHKRFVHNYGMAQSKVWKPRYNWERTARNEIPSYDHSDCKSVALMYNTHQKRKVQTTFFDSWMAVEIFRILEEQPYYVLSIKRYPGIIIATFGVGEGRGY